jgi:hypothetical protein
MISNHLQVTGGSYQNINMVAVQPSWIAHASALYSWTNNTLSHWEGLSCLLIYLIVVYDWKVKDRLPDMTSHRMLLDVGVSQKK